MLLSEYIPIIVVSLFIFFSWVVTLPQSQQQPEKSGRFDYLDGLRGLAAVVVVATHFWRLTPNHEAITFSFADRSNYGSFGVQMFFCITGFLFFGQMISRKGEFSWGDFYTSRVKRIIPAYLAFYVLGIVAVLIYGSFDKVSVRDIPNLIDMALMGFAENGTKKFFAGIELSYVYAVIWTLKFEAIFYFLFPFVVFFVGRVGLNVGFFVLSLLALYGLYRTGGTLYGYFVVGGVAYYLVRSISLSTLFRCVGSLLALALSIYAIKSGFKEYGVERFALASAVFLLVIACKPKVLSSKPLKYLGDISYSVYLVHIPIIVILKVVFRDVMSIKTYDPFSYFFMTMVCVSCVFIFSAAQYKYIERPFLRKV